MPRLKSQLVLMGSENWSLCVTLAGRDLITHVLLLVYSMFCNPGWLLLENPTYYSEHARTDFLQLLSPREIWSDTGVLFLPPIYFGNSFRNHSPIFRTCASNV